ncbi:Protein transport protein Sec24-like [Camellia lanceoleosa]|uniref:Protein transport protein Sec24-like n=1 Tax=Camellia lanceoleosa TaxID=1840588 RepID=A0ACC0I2N3_9ERIC|nr:Protein transport protein Sec24-like [Camellia lanceoleosa]
MQNLQINRPVGQPPSVPNSGGTRHRPPYGQQPPPFSSLAPGASPMTRPGPPPPGVFPRSSVPAGGPPQATLSPNVVPNRPSGPPPVNQPPPPFGVRPPLPGSLPSSMSSSSVPPSGPPGVFPSSGQVGPPSSQPWILSFDKRTTGSSSSQPPPPAVGPAPPAILSTAPHPASNMLSHLGSRPIGAPPGHMQPAAPFSAPSQGVPPPPGSSPFSGPPQGVSPPLGSPYGAQAWPMQPHQVAPPPPIPGSAQQTRMFGMPPQPPNQSMATISPAMGLMGTSMAGPSKIDPNQIPRPIPNSSVIIHETRQGNQANPPPPTTSDYIVKDTGNCSPRYLRCTINQIPCTVDLLTSSGMQLALMVQPMALPHPSEEPIQVVDFGESGPVRCSRCKGYINPFVKFIDQGRRFICNFCGFTDETPRDYHCNLGPDGRRRDAEERPELCRGTVEFVATKEYMVRDPMPAVFFFLIDVSMNAIQTGATAAACSAINQVIADLPEGPRTMVGVATFDSTIHFYNLKRALQQPLMLIVPDVQDVYTPLQTDVIVQLSEAAFLAMKSTGGKLLVFQSVLPSVGIGALSAREAEGRTNISAGEKEAHKLLQPADKILKTLAVELAEYQVCVDVFITTQSYVDIASISVIPRTTGGQVYYYYPFSALSDPAKLYNDLRWNITRPQGFEAAMRVRCSQIDSDKTLMVTLKHDDKLQDGSECAFQCALLYTTVYGQRRIRVSTLSLPCTSLLMASEVPSSPLPQVREQVTTLCINILHSYRKFCATVSSSGQLILPEALKLLPLYTLALVKSTGLRTDGRIDDRSFWISYVSSLCTSMAIPLVYPRMMAIHDLNSKDINESLLLPSSRFPVNMMLFYSYMVEDKTPNGLSYVEFLTIAGIWPEDRDFDRNFGRYTGVFGRKSVPQKSGFFFCVCRFVDLDIWAIVVLGIVTV